jgi:hypothetical protein
LQYRNWLDNFKQGVDIQTNRRQMRIDFTLTLPGLFEVLNIQALANTLGVEVLAKVVFSFSPDIILSPLALPRELLNAQIDRLVLQLQNGALKDVLNQLKIRPNFEEQWPNEYQQGLIRGKHRILKLESVRNDNYTLADILQKDKDMYEWWQNIRTN